MPAYRHILVPKHRSQRVAPLGLQAMIEWLNYASHANTASVESEDGWMTYVLRPGPYAHNLFVQGEAPSDEPAFTALTLAAGDTARTVSLDDEEAGVYFFVRFDGCRFERPLDELGERLHQIMVVRTDTYSALDADAEG